MSNKFKICLALCKANYSFILLEGFDIYSKLVPYDVYVTMKVSDRKCGSAGAQW